MAHEVVVNELPEDDTLISKDAGDGT